MKKIYALRGAISIENDDEMLECVKELYEEILKVNNLKEEDLSFIHFSQTSDLKKYNAAAMLRKAGYAKDIPLFCTAEAEIDNMMPLMVRVLIQLNDFKSVKPLSVYLRKARALRPDLSR